jgi:ATPase family associated with various cellular activities (AAA)
MSDLDAVIAGGRLLLWHGAPGTGKTSALRTLARENHLRIGVEYVLDPEALFGRDAGYFVSVLFDDEDDDDDDGKAGPGKTRLLVLEDCDELLSADAKERSGQGLARLLNLVDGLIGQGLKVGVLITTNEPLSGFHPAVSRPGRCGAVVSFELFTPDEASGWLVEHGSEARALGKVSLAELFAIREGRRPAKQREPIGFVTSGR